MAHRRPVDAPGLLGREPHRLRQGQGTPSGVRIGDLPTTGKWVRLEVDAAKLGLKPGTAIDGWAFTQHGGTVYWDQAGLRDLDPPGGPDLRLLTAWIALPAGSARARACRRTDQGDRQADRRSAPTPEQAPLLARQFVEHGVVEDPRRSCEPLDQQIAALEASRERSSTRPFPTTLVFREMRASPSRPSSSNRGEYDQRRRPGRPRPARRSCRRCPPALRTTASACARWLVAPRHPLTARVAVNRFWQQVFGTGIVKTAEDFGSQGEPPSHPELLDWLAVQFCEDGWDVKQFMKRMRHVGRLPPVVAASRPSGWRRTRPTACWLARPAVPARRRDPPRPGPVRRRPAGREGRRAERQAAAAGRAVGGRRLHRQQHGEVHGRHRASRRSTAAASTPSGSGPRPPRR